MLRRLVVLVFAALTVSIGVVVLSLGVESAAQTVNYPPTTTDVTIQGSTVASVPPSDPSGSTPAAPASSASSNSSLPFTGSNAGVLVWIGIAVLGVGVLVVLRPRARRGRARP